MSEPEQNTEELATGIRSVEQSQGFERMPMAVPDEAPQEDIDSKEILAERYRGINPRQAAEEVVRRRAGGEESEAPPPQQKPIIERAYIHQGGPKAGQKMPDSNVVELDRASRDLSGAREAEQAAEQSDLDQELQRQIDALRSGDTAQPEQQTPQEAYQQAQPGEQTQAQVDPLIEELQRSPKLMEAVGQYNAQVEQQVAQIQQHHLAGLNQNAQTALAVTVGDFGELRGITDASQIPLVIQAVAASGNPQRAQAMISRLQQVSQLATEAQNAASQYRQQQAVAQQQAFSNFAQQHDDAFQQHFDTVVPAAQQRDIQKEAVAMLHEQGLTDQEISALWETSAFRSVAAQKVILDATLYRRARQGIKTKTANPVPVVQRPGSPASIGSQQDVSTRQLYDRLSRSTGREALRAAADIVAARRGRR